MREHPELDGTLRLAVLGDLDLATNEKLGRVLAQSPF
jgi:hypothetical protein